MMKKNKGFTLVELIIVIAILAIIMLIAIPNFSGIQQRMQVRADKSTAAQIGKAFRIWYTEYQSDPAFKNNVDGKNGVAYADATDKGVITTLPKMPSDSTIILDTEDADYEAPSYIVPTGASGITHEIYKVPYFVSYVDTALLPTSLRKAADKTLEPDQRYWVGITGTGTGEKVVVSIGVAGSSLDADATETGLQPLTQNNVTYDGNADGVAYLEP